VSTNLLVKQTATVWQGADGATFDVIEDGSPLSAMTLRAGLDDLVSPMQKIMSYMLLDDGSKVRLPFIEITCIIPDRTGIIAIFNPGQYLKPDGTDFFSYPNNAAIFNADGRLRFQLECDYGHRIAAFHSGSMKPQYKGMMGVLMATHADSPPEWVYAVDPTSPKLIRTGQWVRW